MEKTNLDINSKTNFVATNSTEITPLEQQVDQLQAQVKALEEENKGLKVSKHLDDCVLSFAKTMQYKLDKNKHKACNTMNPDGKGRGWSHCSLKWLLGRLKGEMSELEYALHDLKDEESARDIQTEAADVGNFAMMIHDIMEQATKTPNNHAKS